MEHISRRSFLKSIGVVGATAAVGAGLAACSPAAESSTGSGSAASSEAAEGIGVVVDAQSTEEADIVVVGSGIGGFMASMIAKEQAPDAVVVMLEKNAKLGGSTNYAECNGPATNVDAAEARLKGLSAAANTGYIANSILHAERMKEQGDNADWLFAKHGVGWYRAGVVFYEGGNGSSCIATLTPIRRRGWNPHRGARHGASHGRRVHGDGRAVRERRRRGRAHCGEGRHPGDGRHEHEQGFAGNVLQPGHGQDHRLGRRPGRRRPPSGRADGAWPREPSDGRFAVQQRGQRHRLARVRFSAGRVGGHAVQQLLHQRIRHQVLRRIGRRRAGHRGKRQARREPGLRVLHHGCGQHRGVRGGRLRAPLLGLRRRVRGRRTGLAERAGAVRRRGLHLPGRHP
ncbi:MAG: twin-arginine translocation signal domain-containing protein [Eggerthellaceae bacterium]